MDTKIANKWSVGLRWLARVWSAPAILFAFGELIFPHVDPEVTVPWTDWIAVALMFLSIFGLVLAWWRARLGAYFSLAALALFLVVYALNRGEFFTGWGLVIPMVAGPAVTFWLSDVFKEMQPQV
jgi:hypothetical protein